MPQLPKFVPSKRTFTDKEGVEDFTPQSGDSATLELRRSKRFRGSVSLHEKFDPISEKENLNRSKPLAPRARSAKVFSELVIDLPTDCSDYEVTEEEFSPCGKLYRELARRMLDNERYFFSVFEDNIN